MPTISKVTLKSYFETGKLPTQEQFAAFIDASYNAPMSGEHFFSFIPEKPFFGNANYVQVRGSTLFSAENGTFYSMFVPLPPDAGWITSIRFMGGFWGNTAGAISLLKIHFYTDEENPSLGSPIAFVPDTPYAGYQYIIHEEAPFQSSPGGDEAPFEEVIFFNTPLHHLKYRYLAIEMQMEGIVILLPFGIKFAM